MSSEETKPEEMNTSLDRELDFYIRHQSVLVKQFRGRFLLIKDERLVCDFASQHRAIAEGMKQFEPGTFMVHQCLPGVDNYTIRVRGQLLA